MALLLLMIGCHKSASEHATAKGTAVIEWNAAKSTRPAFKTATFENRATHTSVIEVKACADSVKLKLTFETATAKYAEADQPMAIGALSSLVATVEDGKGFELANGGCDGPNYELTAPGTPPNVTILDCHFHATKPNNDCAALFQLGGDGQLLTK